MKKTLSFFLALVMIVSLFSGLTVTASADYDGTGSFVKASGELGSGYYVFGYLSDGSVLPISASSDSNWLRAGTAFADADEIADPDASIVWYYDAGTGYLSSADLTKYVCWPTTSNTASLTDASGATPVTLTKQSGGYYMSVTATPARVLRYNSNSGNGGWRFYGSTNAYSLLTVFKLSDGAAPVHEHDWGAWTSNNNGTHSRSCQAADCPIGTQTEDCSYEEKVLTEPTCADEGEKEYTCGKCGYSYTETIPATGAHVDEDEDGFCDECGEAMPVPVVFTRGTELHEGDQVVIRTLAVKESEGGYLVLSTTASGSKLKGVEANVSIEEEQLVVVDDATAVLTVEFDGALNFRLKTADGKYLTTGATGNSLSFGSADGYSLWYLEDASAGAVYIKNVNAKYNGKIQALEYYNNLFTAYSEGTTDAYKFALYIVANPDAHVHEWIGEETTAPTCTEPGVMTYTCSGCDESYTEPIPMIPHADEDEDGLCDGCDGLIYYEAETLNDGDRLILVTGAFGKAMTGTETSNGGYLASADLNAQAGVTVPAGDDNVWTVKTADEGFYLLNSEGQYLYVNESNKLALGDEDSDNILWTIGGAVEGVTATGAYLYNPGAGKYVEYGKNYDNYQTYGAPTANYETLYAFTFYTLPAEPLPEAGFTLSPTEVTLEGFDENGDLYLPFVAETLTFGTVEGDEGPFVPSWLHIEFYAGSLSCGTESISFKIYAGDTSGHWGYGNSYGIDLQKQGQEKSILLFIEPSALSGAAPGLYTGTMSYTSCWNDDFDDNEADGPSGTITLSLTVPEPETLDDGFYLLVAHGDEGWGVEFINPEQKFEPNGNNQGEYLLSTTLAVEDEIKVVRVENGAITGWWPNGEGTQYHVDAAHSGNVTIYFKTDYVNDWAQFGGYFYIGSLLKPDCYADVYGCSVSLKGSIGLNFFLIPSETLLADENAYVMLNDVKLLLSEASPRTVGNDTLYQFNISLHAKQMNDAVTLRVYDGEGNPVALYRHSNNENITENGYSYSVMDYIEKTREISNDAKLLALVNAMSDYGSLAQAQFHYNEDDRAPVTGDLDSVTAETLAPYESVKTLGAATGVSYYGTSLLLQSETVLRVYFTLDEGEIGDYSFKLGKKTLKPVESDGMWYVDVAKVSAKDLDKVYTLTVSGADGVIVTVKTCALSYAYGVLNGGSKSDTLIDLVKGLYLYNQAANAYFGG